MKLDKPFEKAQDETGAWSGVDALPPHLRRLHRMQSLPGEPPKRKRRLLPQGVKDLSKTPLGKRLKPSAGPPA